MVYSEALIISTYIAEDIETAIEMVMENNPDWTRDECIDFIDCLLEDKNDFGKSLIHNN